MTFLYDSLFFVGLAIAKDQDENKRDRISNKFALGNQENFAPHKNIYGILPLFGFEIKKRGPSDFIALFHTHLDSRLSKVTVLHQIGSETAVHRPHESHGGG